MEGKRRRRVLLDRLTTLDIEVVVLQCRITPDRSAEHARAQCLARLVAFAQSGGQVATLYIERRDGLDAYDRATSPE